MASLERLDLGIRELHAESHTQAAPFGGIEGQFPDGMQVETTGAALDIAPVAADVEDIDEWQRRELLDMLLDGLGASARGERRAAFLPGVADESQPPIADGLIRRRGRCDREPALVLIDAERALVQAIGDCGARAEIVAVPAVRRNIGKSEGGRGAEQSAS